MRQVGGESGTERAVREHQSESEKNGDRTVVQEEVASTAGRSRKGSSEACSDGVYLSASAPVQHPEVSLQAGNKVLGGRGTTFSVP